MLKIVKSILSMETVTTDNWAFRLLYKYTTILLVISATVVFILMRVDPVVCSGHPSDPFLKVAQAKCGNSGILDHKTVYLNNPAYFQNSYQPPYLLIEKQISYYPVILVFITQHLC